MRTVKEISNITGISVRTLHYYDEIGLLKPTEHLIASIDDILKGDNKMGFAVFNKTEINEIFQAMIEHMPKEIKKKP